MANRFSIHDPVWAKMKGFKPWPGKVVTAPKDLKMPSNKKDHLCVFFFGTDNYAYVPTDCIWPFVSGEDEFIKSGPKGAKFREAVDQIQAYTNQRKSGGGDTNLPPIDDDLAIISATTGTPSAAHSSIFDDTLMSDSTPTAEKVAQKRKRRVSTTDSGDKESAENGTTTKKGDTKKTPSKSVDSNADSEQETPVVRKVSSGPKKAKKAAADASNGSASNHTSVSPYTSPHKSSAITLINRPSYVSRPVTPPLDVTHISDTLKAKRVTAADIRVGFLGLGNMGQGMVKNLINSGHTVTVWNRTPSKTRDFVKAGAAKGMTPADVISASDVTFCCVSTPQAAREMVFGNCGVLQEMGKNKGYVEMTSIDPATSKDIHEAIVLQGGRYLEAPVFGSKTPAEEGSLLILASGDKSLFDECHSCFQSMSTEAFYLGEAVGNASKMNLFLQMLQGSMIASLAEAMALVDMADLSQKDFMEIVSLSRMSSITLQEKGRAMIEGTYSAQMPLQHIQKDIALALQVGDNLEQPLPLAAAANEMFKHAKKHGYGEHDSSAVYIRTRR